MTTIAQGDLVRFNYTGRLGNGEVFDQSGDGDPLECRIGEGKLIPGLERALEGLADGARHEIQVVASEAYGARDPRLQHRIERAALPADLEVAVGMALQMETPQGQPYPVYVAGVEGDMVVLDANHPLAGEDLIFDIEIVAVEKPKP